MMFTDWRGNVRLTNSDPVYPSRESVLYYLSSCNPPKRLLAQFCRRRKGLRPADCGLEGGFEPAAARVAEQPSSSVLVCSQWHPRHQECRFG